MPYSRAKAAMVANTVTMTLISVVVEQPQPRALVRNSKRSERRGQILASDTGFSRFVVGTHDELYGHQPQP